MTVKENIKNIIEVEIKKLEESETKILKQNKMDNFIFENRDKTLSEEEKDAFVNILLNYTFVSIDKDKLTNFIIKNFLAPLIKLDSYYKRHNRPTKENMSRDISVIIKTFYDYEVMSKDYPSQQERKKLNNKIMYLKKSGITHTPIQPEKPYSKTYVRETLIQALNPLFTQKQINGELKPYKQTFAKKIKLIVDREIPLNIIK